MTTLLSRRQELVQPPQFYLIDVHVSTKSVKLHVTVATNNVTLVTNEGDSCHEQT